MKTLHDRLYFSEQIRPEDLPALQAAGIEQIICHRPDGESPDQPDFAAIAQAAQAHGMSALHYPVAGQFADDVIQGTWQALQNGKATLMYCRSGTRSCVSWALGEAAHGGDAQDLIARAADIGYDLTPLKAQLEAASRNSA